MNYVYIVTLRTDATFYGVYADTDSIPDRYMDDDQFAIKQTLIYGTPHSWALVARGDVDAAEMNPDSRKAY